MSSMLIIVIGVFFAAFIQGMTGVGFSMIVMALLPFITSFTQSAQIALILTIFYSLYTVINYSADLQFKKIIVPIIFRFVGGYLGFLILLRESDEVLTLILGLLLFSFSLFVLLTKNNVSLKPTFLNGTLLGTLSGVFTGIASIGGPPLVVYCLAALSKNKKAYLSSLSFCYLIGAMYQIFLHAINHQIETTIIPLLLAAIPSLIVGYILGNHFLLQVNIEKVKKMVYVIICIMGAIIVGQSMLG